VDLRALLDWRKRSLEPSGATSHAIEESLLGKDIRSQPGNREQKTHLALVTCFNRAWKAEQWIEANPAQEADARPEAKRTSRHYVRAEEVCRGMEALAPRWRALFAVSVYLGLRRGEALSLRGQKTRLQDFVTFPSPPSDCLPSAGRVSPQAGCPKMSL
jgi:integrase